MTSLWKPSIRGFTLIIKYVESQQGWIQYGFFSWFFLAAFPQTVDTTIQELKKFRGLSCFTDNNYVSVKSKLQHAPPPGQPPGHLTFLKIIVQIPLYPGQNAVQMPHTRVHSGDQIPPPQGYLTGTKTTEGRRKRLQLSNKIFINITKTEKHC